MGLITFFTGEQPPLVEQAFTDVQVMLRNGHEMFAAATARLLDNEILDADLAALDDEIDRREQDLRRALLAHLNLDPTRELIFSLKLLSIVHEAERIGDLSKTLVRTAALAHKPRMGALVVPLRHYRDHILKMFGRIHDGFVKGEEMAARQLMKDHEHVKAGLTRYLQELADNASITPNEGVVYAMGCRMMSRVSSHLANIASAVACSFDEIRRTPTWAEESDK